MPVTPIRCWLTQAGAGQLAASPGAWKRPRCQCWCESRAPCPPRAALNPPPCPAPGAPQQSPAPQVLLEQAPWKGGQQAAELSSLRAFAPAGTQDHGPPTAEGTCSPALVAKKKDICCWQGVTAAHAGGRRETCGQPPRHCAAAAACTGPGHTGPARADESHAGACQRPTAGGAGWPATPASLPSASLLQPWTREHQLLKDPPPGWLQS